MLVLTPGASLSSYIFVGDLFFIRYWRDSSSFGSILFSLGERRGEPLEESFRELLVESLLFLLLSLMKLSP